jgi:hypothetical protein
MSFAAPGSNLGTDLHYQTELFISAETQDTGNKAPPLTHDSDSELYIPSDSHICSVTAPHTK